MWKTFQATTKEKLKEHEFSIKIFMHEDLSVKG
jgi:hypothetical protein